MHQLFKPTYQRITRLARAVGAGMLPRALALAALIGLGGISSYAMSHAQGDKRDHALSWNDAPVTPRHRSEADWLLDTNQKTFAEVYGPFLTHTYEVGDSERFIPLGSIDDVPESFILAYRTEHTYFWFERGIQPDADTLQQAADYFETRIWPLNTRIYGEAWNPGIDGDSRIHIVNQTHIGWGIFGAFNPADQCPRTICPESNQREIIYVSLDDAPLGSDTYRSTLAHEHQHLIQHSVNGNEQRWFDEGLSQLAQHLNGFDPDEIAARHVREFLRQPDHALRGWSYTYDMGRYYGASYLFVVYLYERFGLDFIQAVAQSDYDGLASIQAAISASDPPQSVDDVFADWIVANYLDDPYVADGRYYYQTLDLPLRILPYPLIVYEWGFTHTDTINQYGADYLRIDQPGTFDLSFDGTDTTPVIDARPKSGEWMWWSYNGASSATRMTGAFDLRTLETATLAFSAWWDTEPDYDWFQVLVSDNGGSDWHIVGGDLATRRGPSAPGAYYSGQSNAWIDEQIDLSAYVGSEILVRVEYLTDGSNTLAGVVLDDLGIVELGALDTVENAESIWQPEGFLRIPAVVPQSWTVTVVFDQADGTTTVQPVTLDALHTGRARIVIPAGGSATIIVGAMAPFTNNPTDYKLSIQMAP